MNFFPRLLLLLTVTVAMAPKPDKPLKGLHFRVANYQQPGTTYKRDKNGTVISATGANINALEWMSQRLGFTYTLVVVPDNRLDPLPNGTWVGCYGLLLNKEVDFIFAAMVTSPKSFEIADFTATVHEEPVVMALPTPGEESRFLAPIKPFSWQVWLVLLGTIVAICCTLIAIDSFRGTGFQTENLSELMMLNIRLLVAQGGFEGASYNSFVKRIALLGWLLCVLILANVYTSSFISASTAPRLSKIPETLEDLAYKFDYQFTVDGKAVVHLYMNATVDHFKVLGDSLRKHPENIFNTAQEAFAKVATGCCVLAFPKLALTSYLYSDYKRTGQCRVTLTKTPWVWDYYVYAAQKGSPYTSTISKEILDIKETGHYSKWIRDAIKQPLKCFNPEQPKFKPMKLADVASIFLILGLGLGLSCVALVYELIYARITVRKP